MTDSLDQALKDLGAVVTDIKEKKPSKATEAQRELARRIVEQKNKEKPATNAEIEAWAKRLGEDIVK